MKRTGRTLRDARTQAGVSLRETARRIGVAAPTLSRIERGRERASDRIVEGYVVALALDRDALYCAIGRVPADVVAVLIATPGAFERVRQGLDNENDSGDVFSEADRDIESIESLLECDGVREEERETFEAWADMLTSGTITSLKAKQRARVERVRRRVGDLDEPPALLWSRLDPDEQERQRLDARRVVMPWEQEKYETPHKLPER